MRIIAVRYARITAVSVKSGSRLGERYGDSIRRRAWMTAVSVKSESKLGGEYWHTTSKSARITTPSVKSGSRLAERYGDSSSMPESQQCRSNLDQNWLRGMRIVSEGMLESQQSVKSGSRLVGMYWHTTSRYSRITTPSVKSGSRLAESYGDQKVC